MVSVYSNLAIHKCGPDPALKPTIGALYVIQSFPNSMLLKFYLLAYFQLLSDTGGWKYTYGKKNNLIIVFCFTETMAVPPCYADLGKSAKDIFNKGYGMTDLV